MTRRWVTQEKGALWTGANSPRVGLSLGALSTAGDEVCPRASDQQLVSADNRQEDKKKQQKNREKGRGEL